MPKTVYVVKTSGGYLAPSRTNQKYVEQAENALTFLSHIHAGIVAKRHSGQVETLTLDDSHGS